VLLGDAAWRLGRLDDAAQKYNHAARLGHDLAIGWLEGFALRGLGLVHEGQEEIDVASEYFESALGVFRSSGFRRGEAMSLLSLGKCARALGDLPQAVANATQAISIFEDIHDAWTVAWGRLVLAASLGDLGRTGEAISQVRQAVRVFEEFKDYRSEATGLVSLGERLREAGDLAGVRDCWIRAADLYEALDDARSTEIRTRIDELEPTSD
jgi:tetratricopeptide (TPR) repeat protein